MILGSHNSWSYLIPKKWYHKLFRFVAQCQDVDIKTQYEKYGVRYFDLRLQFDNEGHVRLVHGAMIYDYSWEDILSDLEWLNDKSTKDDKCFIRILHDARTKRTYTPLRVEYFKNRCRELLAKYTNLTFCNGRNLYNHEQDYIFNPITEHITCKELYSSVTKPTYIDDWCPRIYAKIMNHKIRKMDIDEQVLLIDFVNYT